MRTIHIDIDDFSLEITGEYVPEEPTVWYYKDGSGHPGSPSYFEFNEDDIHITREGKEVTLDDLFSYCPGMTIEDIEELCCAKIEGRI